MRLACDLHIHSSHSFDCRSPVAALLEEAVRKGLDAVAVTDHDSLAGSAEAERIAKERRLPLLVIPGQEVRTRGGELLVLGIRTPVAPKRPLPETAQEAKRLGGFLVAPHPFDWLRDSMGGRLGGVAGLLDAVEGCNAKCLLGGMDRKALLEAGRLRLPTVSSSDAHIVSEVGRCRIELEARGRTPEAVFAAIRAGEARLVTGRIGVLQRVKSSLQKVK